MGEQISDIAQELERLNTLKGKPFIRQLELITRYKGFLPIEGEPSVFHVGMEQDKDYKLLIDAARKALSKAIRYTCCPIQETAARLSSFLRRGVSMRCMT